jgi:hypothetical protein
MVSNDEMTNYSFKKKGHKFVLPSRGFSKNKSLFQMVSHAGNFLTQPHPDFLNARV